MINERFTPKEEHFLRVLYPQVPTGLLAEALDRPKSSLNVKAHLMNISKDGFTEHVSGETEFALLNAVIQMKQTINKADECQDLEVDFVIINKETLVRNMENVLDACFAFVELRDLTKSKQENINRIIKPMKKQRQLEKIAKSFAVQYNTQLMAENVQRLASEHEVVFGPHRANNMKPLCEFLEKLYYQSRL